MSFQEEKTVYCSKHKSLYTSKKNAEDFKVARIAHLDPDAKRKQKWTDLRTVRVYIGSLQVEALGYLHPVASDSTDQLTPVGFTCSRYFWSTRDPTKIVRYSFRTKLVEEEKPAEIEEEVLNYSSHVVVDHEMSKNGSAELSEFRRKCRRIEFRRAKKLSRRSNILPPVFVGTIWKHLQYKDLRPELFENKSSEEIVRKQPVTPVRKVSPLQRTPSQKNVEQPPTNFSNSVSTPTKRLNKAVGNVYERTPTKNVVDTDTDLLNEFLGIGDLAAEDDRDLKLITSILSDEDVIETELNSAAKEIDLKDLEFFVVKTWFNQVSPLQFWNYLASTQT